MVPLTVYGQKTEVRWERNSPERKREPKKSRIRAPTMHLFKENHGFSSVFFSASLNSTSSSSSSSSDVLGLGGASKGGRFLLLSPSSKPLVSPKSKLVDGSEGSRKADIFNVKKKRTGKAAELSHFITNFSERRYCS